MDRERRAPSQEPQADVQAKGQCSGLKSPLGLLQPPSLPP